MRISDWSSDVCSSDLRRRAGRIEVEEFVAPLPGRFAHKVVTHALLAEQQADLAGKGAERKLEKLPHIPLLLGRAGPCEKRQMADAAQIPPGHGRNRGAGSEIGKASGRARGGQEGEKRV